MAEHLRLSALIDGHVHLREPGASYKENVLTGTSAALAGGFVGVLDMPNNRPPIVDPPALACKQALFRSKAVTDYGLFLGYEGGDLSHLATLGEQVVGLKLYLDVTYGNMMLAGHVLDAVFEAWSGPGPIAIHADSGTIPTALDLARRYSQRVHVCHVPDPGDLLVIESARQRGVQVTCEVTPHHLFLDRQATRSKGAFAVMKPPLVLERERLLFWERLALVDMVASDHAPHTIEEKQGPAPPPGVPGLETTLPLMLAAVDEGLLSMERLIDLLSSAPLRIYALETPEDAWVDVEIADRYVLAEKGYVTRCGWSPFGGCEALGKVTGVTIRGTRVFENSRLLVDPGFGRPLRRRTTG